MKNKESNKNKKESIARRKQRKQKENNRMITFAVLMESK